MLELNFEPFPTLQTERLLLRQLNMDDTDDLFELRTNPDAMKHIGRPIPKEVAEVEELIRNMNDLSARIQWAVALKNESKVIGTIGYHIIDKNHHRAEIGYMLHPNYWNKGLMSEAIKVVVNFGFESIGLHSIEARIDPTNEPSSRILKKHGFVKEGYFKESYFFRGTFVDTEIFSLIKS